MQKISDGELVNLNSGISVITIKEDDERIKTELLYRLSKGRKAIEAMEKAKRLCDVIVNSHPDRMIKGEIESMAFELSTYLLQGGYR